MVLGAPGIYLLRACRLCLSSQTSEDSSANGRRQAIQSGASASICPFIWGAWATTQSSVVVNFLRSTRSSCKACWPTFKGAGRAASLLLKRAALWRAPKQDVMKTLLFGRSGGQNDSPQLSKALSPSTDVDALWLSAATRDGESSAELGS